MIHVAKHISRTKMTHWLKSDFQYLSDLFLHINVCSDSLTISEQHQTDLLNITQTLIDLRKGVQETAVIIRGKYTAQKSSIQTTNDAKSIKVCSVITWRARLCSIWMLHLVSGAK